MKFVDLHMHSYHSDGIYSPKQLVRQARLNGLDMIAITDHDNVNGYFEALPEAKKCNIELVSGVEFNTLEHHLVGLNFNPNDETFFKFVKYSRDIQDGVTAQRIEKLQDYGVPITLEKVRRLFPDITLGKVAIAQTMLIDETCRKYLEKRHEKLDLIPLLIFYIGKDNGIAAHVEKKRGIHWQEAIEEIHKAGGKAVFAHPTTKAKEPDEVLDLFENIDGIEIQPHFYEKGYAQFEEYARQNGFFLTYGSDYHGPFLKGEILERKDNVIDEKVLGKIKL